MRIVERGAVYDFSDRIVGFKCQQCGGVFESMFGETCRGCRHSNAQHVELIKAIRGGTP